MKIGTYIAVLLTFWSYALSGQQLNYYFKKYSIRDGLPNNHVRWITQDTTGFLWIGTWDGLVRYDGADFKVYQHDPNDSTTVAFFEIVKICVDSDNRIWIHAGGKVCRYSRRNDNFITYRQDQFPESAPTGTPFSVHDILVDPQGILLVRTGNELYRYDQEQDSFVAVPGMRTLISPYHSAFSTFGAEGDFWFFRTNFPKDYGQVFTGGYDPGKPFSVRDSFLIEQQHFRGLFNNETVHFKVFSDAGQVWLTTNHGLYYLEDGIFRFSEGKLPRGGFRTGEPLIWSHPEKGLMLHYPDEGMTDTLYEPGHIETVIAYYIDSQKNIWFNDMSNPALRQGLTLAYRTGDFFRHYLPGSGSSEPYAFFGLEIDKEGNIWAGGRPNDHLLKISPDGVVTQVVLPMPHFGHTSYPRNITTDSNGNLWIAFFYSHLFRLDPRTLEYTDFSWVNTLDTASKTHNIYRLVRQIGPDRMIAGGGGKLHVFNPSTGWSKSAGTPNNWDLFCIFQADDSTLWVGLSGRLMKTDTGLVRQEIFQVIDAFYNIEDIIAGDSSDLWLALLGGGIGHFDTRTGKTEFYSSFHGLAHNTVYSIRKDRSGNLWVSHNLGISMFDPKAKSFLNFNDEDGLYIREFNSEAVSQTNDGEIFFGGIGGIVSFFPDKVKKIREDAPFGLIITDVRVSNQWMGLEKPAYTFDHFRLPRGCDNFQVAFVRPDFRYGDEMKYRYRLEKVQPEWIITDSKDRMVNYTSLRPGKYRFEVESTGLNRDWKYHTNVMIEIPAYFYQTNTFKIIAGIFVLGILVLLFYFILMHARMVERRKQEHLKLESLRGQMNPHFIFNSLNSINYFISRNDRLNANQFISDFSRLIRAIMNNSSQEYISLDAEIEAIREYLSLEHLRFSDKFDYEIKVDEAIDTGSTEVTPSMVQPFIENAIWHGVRYLDKRKGFLSVRFILENGSLVSIVEDDGIGRKLSAQRKSDEQKRRRSRGIALVEERLKIINALMGEQYTLRITDLYADRKESGTAVRLEVPFRKT